MGQATTLWACEGAVEVRPFQAKKKLRASEAQGLSGEAVKGNPTTTVIPRVDESKPSHRTTEDLTEPSSPWMFHITRHNRSDGQFVTFCSKQTPELF